MTCAVWLLAVLQASGSYASYVIIMYRARFLYAFPMARGGVKYCNPPRVYPAELWPFHLGPPFNERPLDLLGCPRKLPGSCAHYSQMRMHLVAYLDLSCSPRISDRARFMCYKIPSHYHPGQIATPRDLGLSQLVAMTRRIN